ncbi:MAG TPA: hypothetical protein DIW43_03900 [Spongiibacteraceae bacterium]|nr:hypothetical protein [Spongiibacteraceae bacterium]
MLLHGDKLGFRDPGAVSRQGAFVQAWRAYAKRAQRGRGSAPGLPRACLSAPAGRVAFPRHRSTMPSEKRLAANADGQAERQLIAMKEH